MSDDEINKAVKEAAEYEAQDKKRKEAIDARNDAESFVFQTEDALKQVGEQIDANDKAEVEADIAAVKAILDAHPEADSLTDSDVADLKAAQGAAGAGAGPDMSGFTGAGQDAGTAQSADDDVIDADFKEV